MSSTVEVVLEEGLLTMKLLRNHTGSHKINNAIGQVKYTLQTFDVPLSELEGFTIRSFSRDG